MARKYTVTEIDRMRNAIEWAYPTGVPYFEKDRSAEIENRLRTYMQNGTAPEELEEMAEARARQEAEMQEVMLKFYKEQVETKVNDPR